MTKVDVRVKRLHPDAVIPKYAYEWDAGFDIVATEDVIIEPGETALIPTGLAFQIPIGYEVQIRPRSGVSLKTKLRVANSPGTIDSQYRGEVKVIIDNVAQPDYTAWYTKVDGYVVTPETNGYLLTLDSDIEKIFYDGPDETTVPLEMGWHRKNMSYIIRKGDRIAQGILAETPRANFVVIDELDDTTRGTGGFGSTGVKSAYYKAVNTNGGALERLAKEGE